MKAAAVALASLLAASHLPMTELALNAATEELWKADVLNLVLVNASIYSCSLILLTDGDTSTHSIHQILHSRDRGTRGEVVLEITSSDGSGNLTQSLLSNVVSHARRQRRLAWCVTVVVISDDPGFLVAFAEASDNERFIVWTTKLLVVTRVTMAHVHALLHDYWIFSRMNTVFIKVKDKASAPSCQMIVYLPYTPAGSQMVRVASWKYDQNIVYVPERKLFPEKYENFHGMQVGLTWHSLKPYWVEVTRPGLNGPEVVGYTGREYFMTAAMAQALNFTMNPLPYRDWDHVLSRLRTREAFIYPVNLPILPHMLEDYDYSLFLERSTLAFCMAKPSIRPSWQKIYEPMTREVWVFVLSSVLVVYAVLMLMSHNNKGEAPSAWLVMKQVLGTLIDEAIPGELPTRSPTRVVLTAWLIFSFVVGTVYRSNLTACLTVPKYPPRIETFEQLADSGAKITAERFMDMFISSFKQSESKVLKTLTQRINYVPSFMEGMTEALRENSVHLYERLSLEVMIDEDFTNKDGSTELYVTQDSLLADFSAFVLIRDAPFKEKIDYLIMTFHTAGLIDKWKRNAMDDVRREGRQRRKMSQDAGENVSNKDKMKPLTMVHMQGPFLLYIACVITCFVAYLCEVISAVWLHR